MGVIARASDAPPYSSPLPAPRHDATELSAERMGTEQRGRGLSPFTSRLKVASVRKLVEMGRLRIPAKPPFSLAPRAPRALPATMVAMMVAVAAAAALPQIAALPSTLDTQRSVFSLTEAPRCPWIGQCSSLENCDSTKGECVCECMCRWGEIVQCKVSTPCASGASSGACGLQTASCVKCYSNEYVVAAQIALGAGLVFVITALSVLLCKSYLRWRVPSASRRDADNESLNSVQRWVISRLRDRPPRYDEPPAAPAAPDPAAPGSGGGTPGAEPVVAPEYEKPPPYEITADAINASVVMAEGDLHSLQNMPPPAYFDVVLASQPRRVSSMGISNPAFIIDGDDDLPSTDPGRVTAEAAAVATPISLQTVSLAVTQKEREDAVKPAVVSNPS